MRLRKKTFLTLGITLITLIAALFLISRFIFLRSYASLDEQNTRAHVRLVLKAFSERIATLDSKAGDWANWDNTYAFIETNNLEFIKANPTDKTFSELKINLMLFLHSSGRLVFGKAFDLEEQREIPVPQSLQKDISPDSLLLRHSDTTSRHTGIILLPEGPLIIASRPILTSEGKGPVRGTLIFGRYLDSFETGKLTDEAQYALSIYRVDDTNMPRDCRSAIPRISETTPIYVVPLSSDIIGGYTILKDVYGNPALILKLVQKRYIHRQGQKTVLNFILLVVVIALIFGTITIFMFEKQILSRLTKLSEHARDVGTSGDLSRRIWLKGQDEFSHLSDEMNRMLEELEKSEENFRNLFENANDLIQSVDTEGRFLNVNKKWRTMLGYTLDEAKQLYFADILRKDHIPHCMEIMSKVSLGETVESSEMVFVSKEGREIDVEGSINAQHVNGRVICTRGFFRDVTMRKEIERALQESEAKFRTMSNAAKDGIIMMDDMGNTTYWNRAAEKIFGYKGDEIIGKDFHMVLAPANYHEAYRKGMQIFRTTGQGNAVGKTVELAGLRKDGGKFPLELSLSAVKLNEKWNAIGIVRDITNRKNMEAKLKDLSFRDELTGLYNRRGFIELAEQQLKVADRMKRGMFLLFGDLDGMKQINDKYGHQEGDRALKETAALLKATFRESDIIARIGGDEFVALTLETKTENAEILHSRLNQYLADRKARGDLPYVISLSVGIAYYDPEHPESIDQLLVHGDSLMYKVKQKKKT